jgi:hypothetical protein
MTPTIRQILLGRWQATNRQGQTQNFDIYQDAVDFSNTGTMIEYKGFEIDPATFQIYKDNRQVFKGHWQRADSLEDAKLTIDMSLLASSVMSKYHPAVVRAVVEDFNPMEDRDGEAERWMEQQAELNNNQK